MKGGVPLTATMLDEAYVEARLERVLLVHVDARGSNPLPTRVRFVDESDGAVYATDPVSRVRIEPSGDAVTVIRSP
jgi:hypothetical protein